MSAEQPAARTLRDMPPVWAAGHIGCNFDCHVISAAAVDQDALLLSSVEGGDDAE